MTFEEIKAVVRINVIDMFRFNLTCAYLRKKGLFAIAFSLLCFVMSIVSFNIKDTISALLFLSGGLIYTVFVPASLYYRAVMHVKKEKANERDLFYTFNEQGLSIASEDNDFSLAWESIARIVETNRQIVVFINRTQGYIVPKRYFETSMEPLKDLISNKLNEKKYKQFLINRQGIVIPKANNEISVHNLKSKQNSNQNWIQNSRGKIVKIYKTKILPTIKSLLNNIKNLYKKVVNKMKIVYRNLFKQNPNMDINEKNINEKDINEKNINEKNTNEKNTNKKNTKNINTNNKKNTKNTNEKKVDAKSKNTKVANTKSTNKKRTDTKSTDTRASVESLSASAENLSTENLRVERESTENLNTESVSTQNINEEYTNTENVNSEKENTNTKNANSKKKNSKNKK
ncbi:MAG: hypothetical protein K0R15_1418 [Clostridiales bacterium]|jgi:hypothetical protein|nr:hypothetical protein [Clostridiales bacterium]